jgi:hypothetical protein
MAKKDNNEIAGSSFIPTITTEPVLKQLLQAGWRVTEIVNAGILMFSNADEEKQRLFASIGTRFIDTEMNESARNITRDYVRLSEIVAEAHVEKKKQPPESKEKEAG